MKYRKLTLVYIVGICLFGVLYTGNAGGSAFDAKLAHIPQAAELLKELSNSNNYYIKSSIDTVDINKMRQYAPALISQIRKDKTDAKLQSFVDIERQWYLKTCSVISAWRKSTGKNVIIAILDTGIDYENNDLKSQLWINSLEDINNNGTFEAWPVSETRNGITGDIDGIDNDDNGFADDVIGYDFVNELLKEDTIHNGDRHDIDCDPQDEHKHGTEVASVVSSIATDSKLMAVRTHNNIGQSDCYAIAQGIMYAVLNGANVINLSSGEYESSPLFHSAIKFATFMNVVVVCSSGNTYSTRPHYPSDYQEVISVGGINENLQSVFNYGDFLDIAAPATNIYVSSKDNKYFSSNGTSFAAPIVSGVCGLIISYYKTLFGKNISPSEIKTILALNADSDKGWTPQYGSGIVNANKCLDYIENTSAQFAIKLPAQYSAINTSLEDTLTLQGTVLLPLLDNFTVRMRPCRVPAECLWDTLISSQTAQIKDNNICKISLKEVLSNNANVTLGENILSVVCQLKSGKIIEERISVTLYDSNELAIEQVNVFQPYHKNKKINIISVKTNIPSRLQLYYKTQEEANYNIFNSNEYISHNHVLNLSQLDVNQTYHCYLKAEIGNLVSVSDSFYVKANQNQVAFSAKFNKQNYTLPAGRLYKEKLQRNGKETVISSDYLPDIATSVPTNLKFYSLTDNKPVAIDSSSSNAICYGMGDINSDATLDFLCGYEGKLEILSSNESGVIARQLYQIDTSESHIALGLFDIDSDKQSEILYRDNAGNFFIIKHINGEYKEIARFNCYDLLAEDNRFDGNDFSAVAVGNYYNDNKQYIAILSPHHNYITIVDISGNKAVVKEKVTVKNHYHNYAAHISHNVRATLFATSADIDNDNTDELVYMFFGKIDSREDDKTPIDTSDVLGKYELWSVYVYKNIDNKLTQIAEEDFFGVKVNVAINSDNYRNGLNVGDIDSDGTEELLVCAFPSLYALKWNTSTKTLNPFWYNSECSSNLAVAVDFDNDGKNELCFNSFNELIFWEYDKETLLIESFTGSAVGDNNMKFTWRCANAGNILSKSDNVAYELWIAIADSLAGVSLNPADWGNFAKEKFSRFTVDSNSVEIDGPFKTKFRAYLCVKSINGVEYDIFSLPINVWTHTIGTPEFVTVLNNKFVAVEYNQYLSLNNNFTGIKLWNDTKEQVSIVNFTIDTEIENVLLLEVPDLLANGTYHIALPSLLDRYGNFTLADTLSFVVDFSDPVELYLASLLYDSDRTLFLTFSEAIDNSSAVLDVNNYRISPFGTIEHIELIDSLTVDISLGYGLDGRGKDYLLTASESIFSNIGTKMTRGAGNTLGFVISSDNMNSAYIYPSPISLSKHEIACFGHLYNGITIDIKNSYGVLVRSLAVNSGNGGVDWDLLDINGALCKIGIYFAYISDVYGVKNLIKFAIVE